MYVDNKISKTVCIIDDDNIYTILLKKAIERLKLSDDVISFENGENAMASFQNRVESKKPLPDIIFLDINMPIMDGWQFLEAFSKISPNLVNEVCIYQTSSSENAADKKKSEHNKLIKGYLGKTIDRNTLMNVIAGQ